MKHTLSVLALGLSALTLAPHEVQASEPLPVSSFQCSTNFVSTRCSGTLRGARESGNWAAFTMDGSTGSITFQAKVKTQTFTCRFSPEESRIVAPVVLGATPDMRFGITIGAAQACVMSTFKVDSDDAW